MRVEYLPDTATAIKRRQSEWAEQRRISLQPGNPRSSGPALYTYSLEANLFEQLGTAATEEFRQGDGSALSGKRGSRPHLWALHSSDALTVNVFNYWKKRNCAQMARYLDLPGDGAVDMHFEKKFPILSSGSKPPNIDVAIKFAPGFPCPWAGIECKFGEVYPAKRRKLFDEKYFAPGTQSWEGLRHTRKLAETFKGDGRIREKTARHLDRGQLIKHLLGLRNWCRSNNTDPSGIVLIYLWYDADSVEARLHEEEVSNFAETLKSDNVNFKHMTWQALITRVVEKASDGDCDYAAYLKDRYL